MDLNRQWHDPDPQRAPEVAAVIAGHWRAVLMAALKVACISSLFVDPAPRRNGITRLSLKATSQGARSAGCGEITLGLTVKSDDLRAFCVATGFAESGELFTRQLRKRG